MKQLAGNVVFVLNVQHNDLHVTCNNLKMVSVLAMFPSKIENVLCKNGVLTEYFQQTMTNNKDDTIQSTQGFINIVLLL